MRRKCKENVGKVFFLLKLFQFKQLNNGLLSLIFCFLNMFKLENLIITTPLYLNRNLRNYSSWKFEFQLEKSFFLLYSLPREDQIISLCDTILLYQLLLLRLHCLNKNPGILFTLLRSREVSAGSRFKHFTSWKNQRNNEGKREGCWRAGMLIKTIN